MVDGWGGGRDGEGERNSSSTQRAAGVEEKVEGSE